MLLNSISNTVPTWDEGPTCLPIKGATFMQKYLFEPLFDIKKDAKLFTNNIKG